MVDYNQYLESRLSIQGSDDDRGIVSPKEKESAEFLDYIEGWKGEIVETAATNDPRTFVAANAGRLQANLLSMAFDGEKEATRLDATKYALEQAGYGVVKNVQVQHSYDTIPEEQLLAMVKAKFAKIKEALPAGVELKSLLSDESIDAEILSENKDLIDVYDR